MANVTPCGLLHPTLSQPCHLPAGHRQRGAPECVCLLPGQLPIFVGWQVRNRVKRLGNISRGELRGLVARHGSPLVSRAAGVTPEAIQSAIAGKRVPTAAHQRLRDCLRLPEAAFDGGCS